MSEATVVRILYFCFFCCTAAWLPKLADYCMVSRLSSGEMSFILSIPPIMMFAVQPLYGVIADKVGHKRTVLLAAILSSITYAGYLLPGGFDYLIIITILMSVFYNTLQPVLDSIALRIASRDPSFSYGTLRIFGAAGWAVTSVINGQLIDAIDINAIFIVSALAMFLVFLFGFLLKDHPNEKTNSNAYGNVWTVVRNPSMMLLLVCVFLVSVGATTIWNFYSTYLKENGASDSLVGYGLSIQGLCELPLFYFSARIILRLGLKTTLVITVLATAIRLWLYSATKNPYAALPIELLQGFSWSLFWVACVESVNKLVDARWLATGQSLLYAAYFGAGATAGNYWTEHFHSQGMKISEVFFLNAILVGMVVIILMVFMKRQQSLLKPSL